MRIFEFVPTVILLVFPSIASAAPTLYRRACPTIETVEKWIDDNKPNFGENTVFYTAGAKQKQAELFAPTLDPEGWYWNRVWEVEGSDVPQSLEWVGECDTGPEQETVFPMLGEVMASKSTGTAYVLMMKGQPLNAFWRDHEYPHLKDHVKIVAVNAEDFEDTKDYDGVF